MSDPHQLKMTSEKSKDVERKKRSKTTKHIPPECVFCGLAEDCEELLGKHIQSYGMTVHYFCMLLSSGLCQKGRTDKDGILGFMPRDIRAEVSRGKKLTCSFCKKKGATIGCTTKACRISFHLRCGRDHGSLHQFFGNFASFCPTHRPKQAALTSDRLAFFGTANTTCAICMCTVEARTSNETLRSPCCRSSWFHRDCIQRLASTAGLHFFKCPLCNNKDVFQEEMLEYGIYIPDQDAAWEMVPNAYQELLERYNRCDVAKCLCPKGREHNKEDGKWEIVLCCCCGSQGCHVKCEGLTSNQQNWICPGCEEISKKVSKGKKSGRPTKKAAACNTSSGLKEELKKDYEKLQAKACGSKWGSKPLHKQAPASTCSSPGTSELSSPPSTSRRSLQSPKVKNYPETIVRITPQSDNSDIDINVTSSDEDSAPEPKFRKSKSKARRCLQNLESSSRKRCTDDSKTVPFTSPDKPVPIGQPTVRVRQCNVQPGTTVSIHNLDGADLNQVGKRKSSRHQTGRPKKKHRDMNVPKACDNDASSLSASSHSNANEPSASDCASPKARDKPDSYVLSPQIIRNIKAPRVFTPKAIEITDESEMSSEEEVSFRDQTLLGYTENQMGSRPPSRDSSPSLSLTDSVPEDSASSPHPLGQCRKPKPRRYPRRQSRESREMMRSSDSAEVVSVSEEELELATPQQVPLVSSTMAGDPSQAAPSSQVAASSSSSPERRKREISEVHEPVYIDLDNSITDSPKATPPSDPVAPVRNPPVGEEDVLTISSASDEDDDGEVVFLKAERFYSSHQLNGYRRQWMTEQRVSRYQTTTLMGRTVTQFSTLCANTNSGQILMRTQMDRVAMPLHIGSVALGTDNGNTALGTHSGNPDFSTPNGNLAYGTHNGNLAFGSLNGNLALGNLRKRVEQIVSRPAANTRSQQAAVVIDLASDEVPEPPSTCRSDISAEQTDSCPAVRSLSPDMTNNNVSTVSPLKIHQGRLQSIRSAVTVNKAPVQPEEAANPLDASVIDLSEVDDLPVSVPVQCPPPPNTGGLRVNKLSLKRTRLRDTVL